MEMANWKGAAGVCINDKQEVLLVLQGPPDEDKRWSVPAAGLEAGESLQGCCKREFFEETGLQVMVQEELKVRNGEYENSAVSFEVHYFRVEIIGGEIHVDENDPWIQEVAWKPIAGLAELDMAYPDDQELFESLIGQ
ncbi:Putative mutator protein MutT4 [Planococcus massiliensis]|uniref:Putative mutator protein MutT4 n=1 Tax=Planococcus massiliensis TaxID=1499687 RepID=A0A098EQR4_9BACL|nr:NUDIX hydrolase [Planococcus massiliensis]CEG24125.1 Putative mutator protein MutT4 [Planococcus massiliensis]